ncbi:MULTISPECIES: sugar transferase [unclassified Aureimonas]|uniref:sugar transferase n=1 Tax=unclassified Aureimonas TaxID=2615206 RepID=UPI001FCCC9C1|nr:MULTISPECIES: sugar transferase [unclassified Aureimonas]
MYKIQLLLGLGVLWNRLAFDAPAPVPRFQVSRPEPVRRSRASLALKRLIDVVLALFALLALAPVFIFVALAIVLCDGGSVVYRHRRIGQGGRTFDCYKFRSMAQDADARLQRLLATDRQARAEWEACRKLRVDPRVHAIGGFLRRSSLDELPQLVNILRGDMSLVGPRPIVAEEIVRFGPYFADYAAVRPGLTGLWQISGRSGTTYEERVALDHRYATHGSTAVDLQILLKTPLVVLRAQGSC